MKKREAPQMCPWLGTQWVGYLQRVHARAQSRFGALVAVCGGYFLLGLVGLLLHK